MLTTITIFWISCRSSSRSSRSLAARLMSDEQRSGWL